MTENVKTLHPKSMDAAVVLKNVSVRYRVPTEPVATLKEHAIRLLQGRKVGFRDLWALKEIDLQLGHGEALGIVGRNGAGKSTLLKVVSRVIRPTSGRIVVIGRLAPLVELGTGFHPELTGRENVYLNGAMLGFTRDEMKGRLERIVAFSELADFIDAPLRTYSSGMVLRLGFAVATDVEPDVLAIDEVLAVGDEAFQHKCLGRMRRFRDSGTTILHVSHSMEAIVGLCDRAIWLDEGEIASSGDPIHVVDAYMKSIRADEL